MCPERSGAQQGHAARKSSCYLPRRSDPDGLSRRLQLISHDEIRFGTIAMRRINGVAELASILRRIAIVRSFDAVRSDFNTRWQWLLFVSANSLRSQCDILHRAIFAAPTIRLSNGEGTNKLNAMEEDGASQTRRGSSKRSSVAGFRRFLASVRRVVSSEFVERRTTRVGVLERMGSSCGRSRPLTQAFLAMESRPE